MWNDNKSLVLSKVFVVLFMVLLVVCLIFAPRIVERLLSRSFLAYQAGAVYFLLTIYLSSIPAGTVLVSLFLLLKNISSDEVFVRENIVLLRYISWGFFLGGIIGTLSAIYYAPWLPIGIAAAFMGLVVRVVKNVIAKAVSLQDEANYTI